MQTANITVAYAMPIEYCAGPKRYAADPRRVNLALWVLNLSTWMYTAIATARALS